MSLHIQPVAAGEAFDLICGDYFGSLNQIDQETMQRAMVNSAKLWICSQNGEILCMWGLIPPTMLSDRAYLWMRTTEHLKEHVFLFVRHSQRVLADAHQYYPVIVGHCLVSNSKAIRWLKWLGAQFGEPVGEFLPFEIKAKLWPLV